MRASRLLRMDHQLLHHALQPGPLIEQPRHHRILCRRALQQLPARFRHRRNNLRVPPGHGRRRLRPNIPPRRARISSRHAHIPTRRYLKNLLTPQTQPLPLRIAPCVQNHRLRPELLLDHGQRRAHRVALICPVVHGDLPVHSHQGNGFHRHLRHNFVVTQHRKLRRTPLDHPTNRAANLRPA